MGVMLLGKAFLEKNPSHWPWRWNRPQGERRMEYHRRRHWCQLFSIWLGCEGGPRA